VIVVKTGQIRVTAAKVVSGLAILAGLLAAAAPSGEFVRDSAAALYHVVFPGPKSPESEGVVRDYVATTKRAMAWQRAPTIYKPSVDLFEREFAFVDPRRPHKFDLKRTRFGMSVGSLAENVPLAAGSIIAVSGTLEGGSMVTAYPEAVSWAFQLKERGVPRVRVVCRLPLPAKGAELIPGRRVTAEGVVIADGAAERVDGRGFIRIIYMVCAAMEPSMRLTMSTRGIALER
jgi:hypothetical protein